MKLEEAMYEQLSKVRYVGHKLGCDSCAGIGGDKTWNGRVGKVATYLGTPGRYENTVKVHFEGEDGPVYVYLPHLEKA